jgi:hypothetical protein
MSSGEFVFTSLSKTENESLYQLLPSVKHFQFFSMKNENDGILECYSFYQRHEGIDDRIPGRSRGMHGLDAEPV